MIILLVFLILLSLILLSFVLFYKFRCTPKCNDKSCGNDGCGGSCGTCDDTEVCNNGNCVNSSCTPMCNGKSCGNDKYGGLCGTCDDTEVCNNGNCVNSGCTPMCNGKSCGNDKYGGLCGTCDDTEVCGKSYICESRIPSTSYFYGKLTTKCNLDLISTDIYLKDTNNSGYYSGNFNI